MRNSSAPGRAALALLIDDETGRVLQAPPDPIVSRRYLDSHPFAVIQGDLVMVGPDAVRAAGGRGGEDFMIYKIESDYAGSLRLRRDR